MSEKFYSTNEELNFDDSLNNFEYLFKDIKEKSPTLEDALMEMFLNNDCRWKENSYQKYVLFYIIYYCQ